MTSDDIFPGKTHSKPNLTGVVNSLDELKVYLRLKFPSLKKAAHRARLSENRVHQILNGYYLPKQAKIIYRLAKAWDIDAVKLAMVFDENRGVKDGK